MHFPVVYANFQEWEIKSGHESFRSQPILSVQNYEACSVSKVPNL